MPAIDHRPPAPEAVLARPRRVHAPPVSACDGRIALEECWPEVKS